MGHDIEAEGDDVRGIPPLSPKDGEAARHGLLAVSPVPLWPDTNGYALRVTNLLRELSASWDITLVAAASPDEHDLTSGLRVSDYIPVKVRGNIATMPWQLETGPLCSEAERALEAARPACALLWSGIEFLAGTLSVPVTLGDRIDCATLAQLRDCRTAASVRGRWRALRAAWQAAVYERRMVRDLDVTTVVGEADARLLRRISGRDSIHLIPNGTRLGGPPESLPEPGRPAVIFTGTLGFGPNAEAASYFATEVFPTVRARVPDATFVIAGWGGSPDVLALGELPGVEVASDVPDMHAILAASTVAVAPMRSGGGIKNKVLEAWAAGRPVVMTSLAADGLATEYQRGSLIADRPQEFAEAVVRLLRDPHERQRLGRGGYDLVRSQYTWSHAASRMTCLLREALGRPDARARPRPGAGSGTVPDGPREPSSVPLCSEPVVPDCAAGR